MEDFNAVSNPLQDRYRKNTEITFNPSEEPEIDLFNYLTSSGLIDIQQTWEGENTTYTWTNNQSSSRIDYIWTTKNLAYNLAHFKNSLFKDITNSDHSLLQVSFPTENILFKTPNTLRGKQIKQKIIELDKTSEKQWEKFKERTNKKIKENNWKKELQNIFSQNQTTDTNNIRTNNLWTEFENIITSSALLCLHCTSKTITNGNKNHNLPKITKDKTKEFKQYRTIIKTLTKWQAKQNQLEENQFPTIWNNLKSIFTNIGMPANLPNSSAGLKQMWKNQTDREEFSEQLRMTVKLLRNICLNAEKSHIRKEIKKAIEERCLDLQRNQRKIVQTLSNNFRNKITIDRIRVKNTQGEEYIETLGERILQQTEEYYKKAFLPTLVCQQTCQTQVQA